jgi:hypothetical protein
MEPEVAEAVKSDREFCERPGVLLAVAFHLRVKLASRTKVTLHISPPRNRRAPLLSIFGGETEERRRGCSVYGGSHILVNARHSVT